MKMIYLIKDLAQRSGFSVYTLKYYLKLGLIKEIGRSPNTNFRYFDETTVDRLTQIRELRKQKESIASIKEMLKG